MTLSPIVTDRLILREYQTSDFESIHKYASDPEVVQFMEWGPNSKEDTQIFLDRELVHQKEPDRKIFEVAVTLKDSGLYIGGCGLTLEEGFGILGYCLDKDHWGKGYATELTKALMEWGKVQFGLKHFKATCDVQNEASRRVLEKCGFRVVRKIEEQVKVRGRWRDTYFLETD